MFFYLLVTSKPKTQVYEFVGVFFLNVQVLIKEIYLPLMGKVLSSKKDLRRYWDERAERYFICWTNGPDKRTYARAQVNAQRASQIKQIVGGPLCQRAPAERKMFKSTASRLHCHQGPRRQASQEEKHGGVNVSQTKAQWKTEERRESERTGSRWAGVAAWSWPAAQGGSMTEGETHRLAGRLAAALSCKKEKSEAAGLWPFLSNTGHLLSCVRADPSREWWLHTPPSYQHTIHLLYQKYHKSQACECLDCKRHGWARKHPSWAYFTHNCRDCFCKTTKEKLRLCALISGNIIIIISSSSRSSIIIISIIIIRMSH